MRVHSHVSDPTPSWSKDCMPEHKRIGRNIGRIEFLAVQDRVKTMLAAGFDRRKIHRQLIEEGRITMSYPTFCYQFKQQLVAGGVSASAPKQPQRLETSGFKKSDKSLPFSINNKPKLEDFQ